MQRGEWRVRQRKQKEQEDKRRDEKKTAKQKKYISRDYEEKLKSSSRRISIVFSPAVPSAFLYAPVFVYVCVRIINGKLPKNIENQIRKCERRPSNTIKNGHHREVCVCVRCSLAFSSSSCLSVIITLIIACSFDFFLQLLFAIFFTPAFYSKKLKLLVVIARTFFLVTLVAYILCMYLCPVSLQCCQHYSGDAAPHILHLCRRQSLPTLTHAPWRIYPSTIMAIATVALPTSQSTFSLLFSQFVIIAMGQTEVQIIFPN